MTRFEEARFAAWFARQELFERAALATTLAVVASLAFSTAGGVACLALPAVLKAVQSARLADEPQALSLTVSDAHPGVGTGTLDPVRRAALIAAVAARLPAGVTVRGCPGFYQADDVEWAVNPAVAGGQLRTVRKPGRTVAPDDPLHDGLHKLLASGTPFARPNAPGVIVTPRLLAELGYPPERPPAAVQVRNVRTGRPVELSVLGVTADPLPLGHRFLMTEAQDAVLRAGANDEYAAVVSGPAGPNWPRKANRYAPDPAQRIPPAVLDVVDGWGLGLKVDETDDAAGRPAFRWTLSTKGKQRLSTDVWRAYLRQIRTLMTADPRLAPAPDFDTPTAVAAGDRPPEPRTGGHDWAAVYVSDLAGLRPAAAAAAAAGLEVEDSAIPQLEHIEAGARTAAVVLSGLLVVFCLAAAVGLGTLLVVRVQQKAAGVGMLRAFGTADRTLRAVAAATAVYLWVMGTAAGLALAAAGGAVAAVACDVTWAELAAAAGGWLALVAAFLAASLATAVVTTALAVRTQAVRSPGTTLGLTG